MTIHVMQRHIEEGKRGKSQLCPVALAMNEATGGEWRVYGSLAFEKNSLRKAILPPNAESFASTFDERLPVTPFSFEIEL